MITAISARLARLSAVQEVLLLWSLSFGSIVLAFAVSGGAGAMAKIVATITFLYLPLLAIRRRGEDYADYGITFRAWKSDLLHFVTLFAIVAPLYMLGFWIFAELVPTLPPSWAKLISPFSARPEFQFRLPDRFGEWVVDNLLVVALPEEFFYRGFIQTRLRDAWPGGRVIFGARLGKAFWLTAVLFAIGHLAIFEAWRLAVIFPALLFGWIRERTGTVLGAALFHAACNLLALVMQASFFGWRGPA